MPEDEDGNQSGDEEDDKKPSKLRQMNKNDSDSD